jgi:hypothetical protein
MFDHTVERVALIADITVPTVGPWKDGLPLYKSIQASVTNGGSAVVNIEACNNALFPILLGTLTLSAGTPSDFILSDTPWVDIRANVISVSGGVVSSTLGGI